MSNVRFPYKSPQLNSFLSTIACIPRSSKVNAFEFWREVSCKFILIVADIRSVCTTNSKAV